MNKTPMEPDTTQHSPHEQGKSRRTFLNRLWALLSVIALVEIGWFGGSIIKSRKQQDNARGKGHFIEAGNVDSFAPGSVTAIPEGQFYLARQKDGGFLALSRTCTHLGCSLPWDEQTAKFICPCHGSTFDISGKVLTPPATRALDCYPVRIENGLVLVDIGRPEKSLGTSSKLQPVKA